MTNNLKSMQNNEGDTLKFLIYAEDPDLTIPIVDAFIDGQISLAPNMSIDSVDVGLYEFTFIPNYAQGGFPVATFYDIRFFVYDREDVTLFSSDQKRTIQVLNKNLPPVINFSSGSGPFTINEGERVLVVDDLIATGGTIAAAIKLVERLGGNVVECVFLVGLPELNGQEKIKDYEIFTLMEFEGA